MVRGRQSKIHIFPKGSLGGGELDLGMCTILSCAGPIVPPPLCFNFISCMASSSCCWFDGSNGKRGISDLFIRRQTINPWDQPRSCSSSSSFFFSLLDPPSNNWSELANLTWSSFYFFVFFCFLLLGSLCSLDPQELGQFQVALSAYPFSARN